MAIHHLSDRDEKAERPSVRGRLVDISVYFQTEDDVTNRLQHAVDIGEFDSYLALDALEVIEAQRDIIGDLSARIDWVLRSGFDVPTGEDFIFPDGTHWVVPEVEE